MGLIGSILGLGRSADKIGGAVERVVEVFIPNRTKAEEQNFRRGQAALDQLAAEYKLAPNNAFDGFVSGLNRLPRPTLALGTVGLFAYAMADPVGFSIRMQGLNTVPDQLWWLLGAIVTFYFGSRELHYKRDGKKARLIDVKPSKFVPLLQSSENAAVDAWYKPNS